MTTTNRLAVSLLTLALAACVSSPDGEPVAHYDLLIRNGVVYDGTGAAHCDFEIAGRGG